MNAVDISKPRFKANPYPFYAKLRAEHPVFPVKLPDGQTAWLITRYEDALSALKDRRFSKDKLNAGQKQPWTPAFFRPLSRNMLDVDDPDHARLRGLVHKAFTPKMVENMRQRVESLTKELLDAVQPRLVGQNDRAEACEIGIKTVGDLRSLDLARLERPFRPLRLAHV